jgi:Cu(I)/Ag(I) efflux system membrane fusion protein
LLGQVALAAALALALGCGGSRSEPARVESGGLEVAVSLEPAEPRVGENRLWLEVHDDQGRPVDDVALRVKVHMAAMGAMPAMGGFAPVQAVGAGRHRADFALEMGGSWRVEIEATPGGEATRRFDGSLTVGSPGLRLRAEASGSGAEGDTATGAPEERHPAEFTFEPARLQKIGVRTVAVERARIGAGVRTVGRVVYDETRLVDVSPRVRGWIEELRADSLGMRVERGDVLFTVYSPELHAAQQELLQALRSESPLAPALVRAARNRLRLWGVSPGEVEHIERRGEPIEALPVRAATSGFVIEKLVVAGSAIAPGQRLLRIAPLEDVWVEAELYEADLPRVHVGQAADVTLSHRPGRHFSGTVGFVDPFLSRETRTARARIVLENPELVLRPDMFADVELLTEGSEALVVPVSAVLHAGDRQFVFVALGEGRFRPQAVELGVQQAERVEVVSGLSGDERVVSSGTFLIASESRLRAALEQW